jgi:7-cyano-7-deazaguanine tRNA-ribosyltransferase
MPFQIHALGSPTEVMERYLFPVLVDMIMAAKLNLPQERPLHLFGAGHPMMFSLAVALGCDLFDSASYALYAKDDRYLTTMGTSRMENLSYLPCSCPVCHGRSAEDLKEMTKGERERLLAEHNLHACMTEINTIKQAIVEGSLWDLVERRSRGHPSMTAALKRLTNYRDAIEKGSPLFKGHGVFYYDYHSLARPEVTRYHRLLESNYSPPVGADTLLLVKAPSTRPYRTDPAYRGLRRTLSMELGEAFDGLYICFYAPPYGCIPEDLSETYPLSQYDIAEPADEETIKFTAQSIARYIGLGGFHRMVLHRGVERLDLIVAEAAKEACEKLGVIMETSGSAHPWGDEAARSLLALLSHTSSPQ